MNLKGSLPMMVFDDGCRVCISLAKALSILAAGRIRFVGQNTGMGRNLEANLLGKDAKKTFWFIDKEAAYGGRSAIYPIIRCLVASRERPTFRSYGFGKENCKYCDRPKSVFIKTKGLLSYSRKIKMV